ncbi:hypothetical protein [Arenibacter sp. TNZ]|nr:hypothetical protein [Arenibacter sp. TNZ]
MIYITQLIYVIAGQEEIFHQFEDIAIPTIGYFGSFCATRFGVIVPGISV